MTTLKTAVKQTKPPPKALRFSHGFTLRDERETRVTGDDAQGTLGRVKPVFIERETSGY